MLRSMKTTAAKTTGAILLTLLLVSITPWALACEISCNLGQPDGTGCRHEAVAHVAGSETGAAGLCIHHVHAFGKRTATNAPALSVAAFQSISDHLAWSGPSCNNTPCHDGSASVEPGSSRSVSLLVLLPAPLQGITVLAAPQPQRPLFQNRDREFSPHHLDPLVSTLRI
jgi:hypothetical protein